MITIFFIAQNIFQMRQFCGKKQAAWHYFLQKNHGCKKNIPGKKRMAKLYDL